MLKCSTQLFHDSSSCVVGSCYLLTCHNCVDFSSIWLLLNLNFPLPLLAWKVSHTVCHSVVPQSCSTFRSCRLCCQWRCAGYGGARMESAWAAWPLGVCVGVHWTLPSCSSTDACTACTSNVIFFPALLCRSVKSGLISLKHYFWFLKHVLIFSNLFYSGFCSSAFCNFSDLSSCASVQNHC